MIFSAKYHVTQAATLRSLSMRTPDKFRDDLLKLANLHDKLAKLVGSNSAVWIESPPLQP